MIIPVNYSEEEMYELIQSSKENDSIKESVINAEVPKKVQESDVNVGYNDKDYAWGFFFFEADHIYANGNKVYYCAPVTKDSVNELKRLILDITPSVIDTYNRLGIYNPKKMEIQLYINSGGGSIAYGFDLIDFIKSYPIPIVTIGTGTVASMAVPIVQAGSTRYLTKNCHVLIHQFRAGFQGKRQDILDLLKHLEKIHQQLITFISENSKLPYKKVEDLMKNESWFNAEESIEMGIVDEII